MNGATDGHGTKMTNGTGEVHSSSRGKCTGVIMKFTVDEHN